MPVTAIVPLKPPARAKSRLLLDAETRVLLANAFARDLIDQCLDCADIDDCVVVGTGPPEAPVPQLADPGQGLNYALSAAAATIPATDSVVILMGDLPCVRSEDLSLALHYWRDDAAALSNGAFVSDLAGIGTTAVLGQAGQVQPEFGARSRAAHHSNGLVELRQPELRRLRRDVDSLVDLADALRLGVGPHTRACVADLDLVPTLS